MGENKPAVLLSYRRDDSPGTTGRIFDRLAHHYGRECVFMDIDAIPVGVDFREHIRTYIERSDVVLVVIGPNWNVTGDNGKRRLSNPRDWVRVEIEAAIEAKIALVPVCVDGGSIPITRHLPKSLRGLPYLQAATVHPGRDFDTHVQRLIRDVSRLVERSSRRRRRSGRPLPGKFKVSSGAPQPTLEEVLESIRGVLTENDSHPRTSSKSNRRATDNEAAVEIFDLVNELGAPAVVPRKLAATPLEKAALALEQRIAALKAGMSKPDLDAYRPRQTAEPTPEASQPSANLESPSGLRHQPSHHAARQRESIHKVAVPGGTLTVFDDSTIELRDAAGTRLFRNFSEFERYWRRDRQPSAPDQDGDPIPPHDTAPGPRSMRD